MEFGLVRFVLKCCDVKLERHLLGASSPRECGRVDSVSCDDANVARACHVRNYFSQDCGAGQALRLISENLSVR